MAAGAPEAAINDVTMEVSGYDGSLQEAIHDGVVPTPILMSFNMWQVWRINMGRRPTMEVDGVTRTTSQEAALWRLVMGNLHGDGWNERASALSRAAPELPQEREPSERAASAEKPTVPPGSQSTGPAGGGADFDGDEGVRVRRNGSAKDAAAGRRKTTSNKVTSHRSARRRVCR